MKNIIIGVVVIALLSAGVYFLTQKAPDASNVAPNTDETNNENTQEENVVQENKEQTIIGKSAGGNDIKAYHYGNGNDEILFIGGIHGGYSWNTSLVAYEMADYLKANPQVIPANLEVTVIPVLNPDGLIKVTGTQDRFTKANVSTSQTVVTSGRFNGNNVDLSRNFDCNWQANALWQSKPVSGGTAVFSEPESVAIKNYVEANNPEAVVVWYSSEGKVYSSSCGGAVLPETTELTNLFAKASGYPASASFNAYKVTGDIVDWLAKGGTPAISVLLTNHTDTDWTKNKAGLEAVLEHYGENNEEDHED